MKKTNPKNKDEMEDKKWDFKQIMKDVHAFGTSHMTWKEKKELENQKVVKLGGKPPKKQRLPLSVARVQMKKQKEREQKVIQEDMILERFGGKAKRSADKSKADGKPLRSSEGYFRNGVLDVKHMLNSAPRMDDVSGKLTASKGKKVGSKRKSQGGGKRKGGGRKRR